MKHLSLTIAADEGRLSRLALVPYSRDMQEIEMAREEPTLFVVVLPTAKLEKVQIPADRILAALSDQFPDLMFAVAETWPIGEHDEFVVVPVTGEIGEWETMKICEDLPLGLLEEIKEACEMVDLSVVRRVH
ncbi:MAG: hypothetical protein ACTHJ3_02625 [Pararhizobium sp.]